MGVQRRARVIDSAGKSPRQMLGVSSAVNGQDLTSTPSSSRSRHGRVVRQTADHHDGNQDRLQGVLITPGSSMHTKFLRSISLLSALLVTSAALAQSVGDRVYTADQSSNTVSVIDPGVISLGAQVPAALSPLYRGELLVHGLGFSPDGKTLAAVSIGSNSVTLIDTATNTVRGKVYLGRSPHEAFFTPDGLELWAAVRGEDYVSVIDPAAMKEKRRVTIANGPGMVLFNPNGRYAYVPSSLTPELSVIDTRSYRVIAHVKQASPFSPNLAVSQDGQQVWFTLKDSGKTQVMNALPPFNVTATLDTGPVTNHVVLADTTGGKFAYITVGGLNVVKVYTRDATPKLVASIPTGALPHGAWAAPDGKKIYVGLEGADQVQVIDTASNTVVRSVPTGQLPQALVYVPGAVKTGTGTANLIPLDAAKATVTLNLAAPSGPARATVSVNPLGLVDLVQIVATGLTPSTDYVLKLTGMDGQSQDIAGFKTSPLGIASAQTIGPVKKLLTSGDAGRQTLSVVPKAGGAAVLVQTP